MKVTKKLADEMIKNCGGKSGISFKGDYESYLSKFGENGILRIEERLERLGHRFTFATINERKTYPLGLNILTLLLIKEIFKATDEDIMELGENGLKLSFAMKLVLRLMKASEAVFKSGPSMWNKHNELGRMIVEGPGKDKKKMKIIIKDFLVNTIICTYLKGYFKSFIELAMPGKKVSVDYKRCRGEPGCHEFTARISA